MTCIALKLWWKMNPTTMLFKYICRESEFIRLERAGTVRRARET